MADKLLITLPCSIRELKDKLEQFDKYDVVVCKYDGDGDSLYVVPVMEPDEEPNGKKEPRINGLTIPEYVRTMERAHEATKNSKLVFK